MKAKEILKRRFGAEAQLAEILMDYGFEMDYIYEFL